MTNVERGSDIRLGDTRFGQRGLTHRGDLVLGNAQPPVAANNLSRFRHVDLSDAAITPTTPKGAPRVQRASPPVGAAANASCPGGARSAHRDAATGRTRRSQRWRNGPCSTSRPRTFSHHSAQSWQPLPQRRSPLSESTYQQRRMPSKRPSTSRRWETVKARSAPTNQIAADYRCT